MNDYCIYSLIIFLSALIVKYFFFTTSKRYSSRNATTVNQKHSKHFNDLSSMWWGPELEPLRALNAIRVPTILNGLIKREIVAPELKYVKKPLEGLKILDVGCGGGFLSEALAELGANVTGIDIGEELIEVAKLHSKDNKNIENNLTYIAGKIEEYCEEHLNEFDAIMASEVVDHVESYELLLKSAIKCLKPGGYIFVSTINRTYRAWFVMILLYEYITHDVPKGSHELKMFVKPEEVTNILQSNNCTKFHQGGWYFDLYTREFHHQKSMSVLYYIEAVKTK